MFPDPTVVWVKTRAQDWDVFITKTASTSVDYCYMIFRTNTLNSAFYDGSQATTFFAEFDEAGANRIEFDGATSVAFHPLASARLFAFYGNEVMGRQYNKYYVDTTIFNFDVLHDTHDAMHYFYRFMNREETTSMVSVSNEPDFADTFVPMMDHFMTRYIPERSAQQTTDRFKKIHFTIPCRTMAVHPDVPENQLVGNVQTAPTGSIWGNPAVNTFLVFGCMVTSDVGTAAQLINFKISNMQISQKVVLFDKITLDTDATNAA